MALVPVLLWSRSWFGSRSDRTEQIKQIIQIIHGIRLGVSIDIGSGVWHAVPVLCSVLLTSLGSPFGSRWVQAERKNALTCRVSPCPAGRSSCRCRTPLARQARRPGCARWCTKAGIPSVKKFKKCAEKKEKQVKTKHERKGVTHNRAVNISKAKKFFNLS